MKKGKEGIIVTCFQGRKKRERPRSWLHQFQKFWSQQRLHNPIHESEEKGHTHIHTYTYIYIHIETLLDKRLAQVASEHSLEAWLHSFLISALDGRDWSGPDCSDYRHRVLYRGHARSCGEEVPCGEEEVPCGHEEVLCGQEEVPCGQKEVPCGEEEVRCGQEEVSCGQEEVPCGQEEVLYGQEVTCPCRESNDVYLVVQPAVWLPYRMRYGCFLCNITDKIIMNDIAVT